MFKKIVSLVIVFSMLMSIGAYAQMNTAKYTPDELPYEAKVSMGLGAIETYEPEKKVSQGEFAMAINAIGAYDTLADNYINKSAYEKGITLADAVVVMCDIIGYTAIIEKDEKGNINKNHAITVAQKQKLVNGISGKYNEALTIADLVMLVSNMIEVSTLNVSYGANGAVTEIRINGEVYGERALGVYITEGVVRSTSFSSIIADKGTEDNFIDINGVKFSCETGEYEDYIGMRVKAVIKKENNRDVVKALYSDSNCLRISARDLNFSDITKTSVGYYDENGRLKSARLSPSADALYNFSFYRDFTAEDMKIKQGALVLIDNTGDSKYDIVRIEEYRSMQIFSASVSAEKISDSKGNVLSISELIENNYPIIENGKVIFPENIPVNSIATYFVNKADEIVRLYITSQLAGGTISGFDTDSNIVYFTDGEKDSEYVYTEEIKADLEALKLGTQVMVNVNHYGEIAHFEVTKDTYLYGYMVGFDSGKGFKPARVKVYNQDNKFEVYNLKDKVLINGITMSANQAFSEEYKDSGLYDELGPVTQVIKYKLNGKGEIKEICTTSLEDKGDSRLHKEKDGVYTYYSTPKTICADTRLDINTKVFVIPTDLTVERRFRYGNHSLLTNDTDYTAQVYDIDDDRIAGVVVVRVDPFNSGKTLDDINGTVYMVDKIGKFIADSGEESYYADCMRPNKGEWESHRHKFNRKEISSSLDGVTITVGQLKQGDVILVSGDGTDSGEMATFKLLYRVGETAPYESVKQMWYSASNKTTFISDGNAYVCGKIRRLVKNGFIMNPKPGEYWDRVITMDSTLPVWIHDSSRGKIVQGSIADICEGDEFYCTFSAAKPYGIVLYR